MSNSDLFSQYGSRIKDIYIELPNFRYQHGPFKEGSDSGAKHNFVGREEVKKKISSLLDNENPHGIYLITGFRGVGKTSLVRKAVDEIPSDKKIYPIHISLAQEKLKSTDVLRVITKRLWNEEEKHQKKTLNLRFLTYCLQYLMRFFLSLSVLLLIIFSLRNDKFESLISSVQNVFSEIGRVEALDLPNTVISVALIILSFYISQQITPNTKKGVLAELNKLKNRLHSENEKEEMAEFTIKDVFKKNVREKLKQPIIDFRELEDDLINILKKIKDKHKRSYIFIFDELDKIEPNISTIIQDKEKGDNRGILTEGIRNRQRALAEVLVNLKYFLNEAKAKFVFIAGREMYDANLADIADRNFFWGSIFHDVIYVESFLKEKNEAGDNDLTAQVEEFVCDYLFPSKPFFIKHRNKNKIK